MTETVSAEIVQAPADPRQVPRRRVLIVASTYAPAMSADMHRARMLAWELPEHGWDVEILCPAPSFQPAEFVESDSSHFFPGDGVVHRVEPSGGLLFRALGMRTIGWRSILPLYRAGLSLLRTGRFDVVFFTTTQFNLFLLGPLWRSRTQTPYALDYHDPWRRDSRRYRTTRSSIKRKIDAAIASWLEPVAVRNAAGLVTVSPQYFAELIDRYGSHSPRWLEAARHATVPFAGMQRDFADLSGPNRNAPDAYESSALRMIYVGAGGEIMAKGFATLCRSLRSLIDQGDPFARRLRIELYGTSWGPPPAGLPCLQGIAVQNGLEGVVTESPQRVSYRQSGELLSVADGILVLGVDDIGYMPSKLFSYALTAKPLLACLRRGSPAWQQLLEQPELGRVISFDGEQNQPSRSDEAILAAHLRDMAVGRTEDRRSALAPYLAPAMAERIAKLLSACVES